MPLIDTGDKENHRPKCRRNQGRPLKRLVDVWDRAIWKFSLISKNIVCIVTTVI